MSWLENTSQIKGLPDVAINPFSFIDCDALTNDITIIFYVCILYIIRNLISTTKLGAMYPFKDSYGKFEIMLHHAKDVIKQVIESGNP